MNNCEGIESANNLNMKLNKITNLISNTGLILNNNSHNKNSNSKKEFYKELDTDSYLNYTKHIKQKDNVKGESNYSLEVYSSKISEENSIFKSQDVKQSYMKTNINRKKDKQGSENFQSENVSVNQLNNNNQEVNKFDKIKQSDNSHHSNYDYNDNTSKISNHSGSCKQKKNDNESNNSNNDISVCKICKRSAGPKLQIMKCYSNSCKNNFCSDCFLRNHYQARSSDINCKYFNCECQRKKVCIMSTIYCTTCDKRICSYCYSDQHAEHCNLIKGI